MTQAEYNQILALTDRYTDEQLRRAAVFYSNSPDGQWDDVACFCIQMVLARRELNRD